MTSDTELLAHRDVDDALGLIKMATAVLADSRTGRNGWQGCQSGLTQPDGPFGDRQIKSACG